MERGGDRTKLSMGFDDAPGTWAYMDDYNIGLVARHQVLYLQMFMGIYISNIHVCERFISDHLIYYCSVFAHIVLRKQSMT